jgi:hypothetical protein
VSAAFGLTATQSPEFEVASIKPSAPMNGQVVNVGVHIDGALIVDHVEKTATAN